MHSCVPIHFFFSEDTPKTPMNKGVENYSHLFGTHPRQFSRRLTALTRDLQTVPVADGLSCLSVLETGIFAC